jgi:ketosteroid isomerase-like protein
VVLQSGYRVPRRARGPPLGGPSGIEAVRRQFQGWIDAYPDLTVEPLEARGSGEKVFLWVRFSGHGAASGIPLEMELAHVITMRDGRVARTVEFMDRAEALEAAGLRE